MSLMLTIAVIAAGVITAAGWVATTCQLRHRTRQLHRAQIRFPGGMGTGCCGSTEHLPTLSAWSSWTGSNRSTTPTAIPRATKCCGP